MRGELAHPPEECVAINWQRRSLDYTGVGMAFHQAHQVDQAVSSYDAVGIEHNHIPVSSAPTLAKVGDIARFTIHIFTAIPVKNTAGNADGLPEIHQRHFLAYPDVGIGGVAQDEKLIERQQPGLLQAKISGL